METAVAVKPPEVVPSVAPECKDTLPIHPAANLFPLLEQAELTSLADDIKKNGLANPILLFGGQILDGRNRYQACQIAGIEPRFKEWTGTDNQAVAYVLSQNLTRRHLTSSQRAAIALEAESLLKTFREQAKARQQGQETFPEAEKGQTRDKIAEIVGTNGHYISDVQRIQERAPELVPDIKKGAISISAAKAKLASGSAKTAKTPTVPPTKEIVSATELKNEPISLRLIRHLAKDIKHLPIRMATIRGNVARDCRDNLLPPSFASRGPTAKLRRDLESLIYSAELLVKDLEAQKPSTISKKKCLKPETNSKQ